MTLNVISRLLSALEKDYKLTPGTNTIDWAVRSTDAMGQAISEWAAGESFEITVKGPGTGVESLQDSDVSIQKVLRDGVIYIEREGKTYDLNGREVR